MAGRYSGKETDKISLLKEAGLTIFYTAKNINVLMVHDAASQAGHVNNLIFGVTAGVFTIYFVSLGISVNDTAFL